MVNGKEETLHVALDNFENIVIMKAFKSIGTISDILDHHGIDRACATVLSNIGMDDEYIGPLDTTRDYGYFTTVLIKRSA
jgi:precorrin-2/cobalt-factor-2 C20-methyltransferase